MEKEQVKKVGNIDSPIVDYNCDRLSMSAQIEGLASFIRDCETPMTISVQGTWGSGKTSFFNMVKNKIQQEDEEKNCVFAEFNSWQFVQFDMSEQLATNMIIALIHDLYKAIPEENREKKEAFYKVINGMEALKAGGKLLLNTANDWAKNKLGVDVKEQLDEAGFLDSDKILRKKEERQKTAVEIVSELKKDFEEVVKNRLAINEKQRKDEIKKKRIIFFVDDLDRLPPDKAIEVLEVLKMFLDCEHCVFVLAIDYKVVVNGVALKYKNSISEAKGAEFFEKMIQVVYTLPDTLSHTDRYIAEILRNNNMNISLAHEFTDLVKSGKRDNPRAIKRLMNSYLLLEQMRKKACNHKVRQDENVMLFALLCMQNICPEVYDYLYEKFSFPYDYEKGTRWFNNFKVYCYYTYHKIACEFDFDETEYERLVRDNYSSDLSQTKLGFMNSFFEKMLIGKYVSFEALDIHSDLTISNILDLKKSLKLTELTRVNENTYSDNDSVSIVKINYSKAMCTQDGTITDAYKLTIGAILDEVVHYLEKKDLYSNFDDIFILDYKEVMEHFADFLSVEQRNDGIWEPIIIGESNLQVYVKIGPDDATRKVKNVIELSEYTKVPFVWYSNLAATRKLVEGYDSIHGEFEHEQSYTGSQIYYINMGPDNIIYVKDHSICRAYYETVVSILRSVEMDIAEQCIETFDFLSVAPYFDTDYEECEAIGEEDDPYDEKYGEWRWSAVVDRDSQIDFYIHVDGLKTVELIKNVRELSVFCSVNFYWYGDPYMSEAVVYGYR